MENNKLMSMTDLILNQYKDRMDTPYNDGELVEADSYRWYNYAKFLKQPLKLEYFVPCLNGEPITHPEKLEVSDPSIYMESYIEAQKKVLFEGF